MNYVVNKPKIDILDQMTEYPNTQIPQCPNSLNK